MTRLPFDLGPPLGHRANFGLIVLRTDETIEHEARQVLQGDGVAHYVSRIPCETEVTMDALARMEAELPRSAALLPATHPYDVVGYGCTSGATRIGPDKVAAGVRAGIDARAVTDPLTATIAACRALGITRLGFVTPYLPEVSDAMRAALTAAGLEIAGFGSMEEPSDERVARIEAHSLRAAILSVAAQAPCDAVFLACTNLRALPIIAETEAELGKPVLTSNQALLWHMMVLAGLPTELLPFGALMRAGG
ncbi:Asp/Glu racemase [Mesobacterium pallidum]|uniref:maleate cis-trans isomerase family protein n=1 Tax=Mesobacterium pallidum TaxID=2872037 RepID=UPI001EE302B3|nr:Asp/Glu racemase [Mesobacterium pallidum]